MSEYELNKRGKDVVSMLRFVCFVLYSVLVLVLFQVAINLYLFMLWFVFCVHNITNTHVNCRAQFKVGETKGEQ